MNRAQNLAVHAKAVPLVAAACAALTLAGCSSSGGSGSGGSTGNAGASGGASSGAAQKHLRIGFSPYDLSIPAFKGLSDGLTAIAKSQGDTVISADPKSNPSTQLQQLQQWVQLGRVDAIWTIPVSTKTVAPVIQQAAAKGIVVIAAGAPSDYGLSAGAKNITFTSVDYASYGSKLATLASTCISQRLGGKGKIIYLGAQSGAQSNKQTDDAVKDGLQKSSPGSSIVSTLSATTRIAAQQSVASALQGHPDADVLIATNDEGGLGGLAAFTQDNKSAKSTCVISAGGTDEAVADAKSGKLFGEVAFDFQGDLMQNYQQIKKLAAQPGSAGTSLVTPIKTVTG